MIKLAYGLGTVPCSLTAETCNEVTKLFHPSQLEWLVAATSLFGMFNKLMDGLNIPLETSTYQETIDIMDTNYTLGRAAAGMIEGESTAAKAKRQPPPPTDDWTNIIAIVFHGLRPGVMQCGLEGKCFVVFQQVLGNVLCTCKSGAVVPFRRYYIGFNMIDSVGLLFM